MPQITKWFQSETFPYLSVNEISGLHNSVYEDCSFLGCDTVYPVKVYLCFREFVTDTFRIDTFLGNGVHTNTSLHGLISEDSSRNFCILAL